MANEHLKVSDIALDTGEVVYFDFRKRARQKGPVAPFYIGPSRSQLDELIEGIFGKTT